MRRIWIVSLFPNHFEAIRDGGVVAQVLEGKRGPGLKLEIIQLRDYALKDYKGVDDAPYGGGHGMVMRADILKNALAEIISRGEYSGEIKDNLHVIYTSPRGKKWSAQYARDFAKLHWSNEIAKDLVFICGRYEGIDERFIAKYIDEEISIGDFVLSGGELAVMVILDAAMRFMPGALGNQDSYEQDSFEGEGLLECPFYTRPPEFEGLKVPEILLSGNHKKIAEYRVQESLRVTKERRPELYEKYITNTRRGKSE